MGVGNQKIESAQRKEDKWVEAWASYGMVWFITNSREQFKAHIFLILLAFNMCDLCDISNLFMSMF